VLVTGGRFHDNQADRYGGGLYTGNQSILTMTDTLVIGNTAQRGGGGLYLVDGTGNLNGVQIIANHTVEKDTSYGGGGLYVHSGSVTIQAGQIFSNTATNAGGIFNYYGEVALINSTLSDNHAQDGNGGGLYNYGPSATTWLTFTTVASNTVSGIYSGGGLGNSGGEIIVQDSLLAHNQPLNCSGGVTSNGHNLDNVASCAFDQVGDLENTDPLLLPLTMVNLAWVHPLHENSPAIDAGFCLPGLTTVDGRGAVRPYGSSCDIGAYEYRPDEFLISLPLLVK
jgi:hypothetical protein